MLWTSCSGVVLVKTRWFILFYCFVWMSAICENTAVLAELQSSHHVHLIGNFSDLYLSWSHANFCFVLFCSFTHITSERTQRAVLRKSGKTFFTSRKFTSVSKQHLRPKHLKRIQQVILLFTPSHTPFFNVTSKKVCCEIKTVVQRHNTYYSRYTCRLKQSFKESAGPHLFFSFSAKNLTISEV